MNSIKSFQLDMQAGEIQKFRASGGSRVHMHCLTGSVWVTRKGDPKDYVLEAGNQFEFAANRGELLIQSLDHGNQIAIQVCN